MDDNERPEDRPPEGEGHGEAPENPREAVPEEHLFIRGESGARDDVAQRLDLDEPARLPWLESIDDDEDEDGGIDTRRVAIFVAFGIALLAVIVGGIWWSTHRNDDATRIADGSTIAAPAGPYKSPPAQPGGKTYQGTGDSSFAVSAGHSPTPHLAGSPTGAAGATVQTAQQAGAVAMAAAKATGSPTPAPGGSPAMPAVSGIGVQVGAYTSQASAEAGWAKLEKQYEPLAGMRHRIVQGQADIGTVYRVQAVAESDSAANALCAGMKARGLACQVKH